MLYVHTEPISSKDQTHGSYGYEVEAFAFKQTHTKLAAFVTRVVMETIFQTKATFEAKYKKLSKHPKLSLSIFTLDKLALNKNKLIN